MINYYLSTKTKKVVFDVDHTLIDEKGESVRPGIVDLLKSLIRLEILRSHKI